MADEPTTRERLLELASTVFAEEGYAAASVRDLAARSQLTSGAIYGNFRSKADLLLAAIDTGAAAPARAPPALRPPDDCPTTARHPSDTRPLLKPFQYLDSGRRRTYPASHVRAADGPAVKRGGVATLAAQPATKPEARCPDSARRSPAKPSR